MAVHCFLLTPVRCHVQAQTQILSIVSASWQSDQKVYTFEIIRLVSKLLMQVEVEVLYSFRHSKKFLLGSVIIVQCKLLTVVGYRTLLFLR